MLSRQSARIVENGVIIASAAARCNSSAMLRYNDAMKLMNEGHGEWALYAAKWAIKYGFGVYSKEYTEINDMIIKYKNMLKI